MSRPNTEYPRCGFTFKRTSHITRRDDVFSIKTTSPCLRFTEIENYTCKCDIYA